jgi:hypothetical protein
VLLVVQPGTRVRRVLMAMAVSVAQPVTAAWAVRVLMVVLVRTGRVLVL